MEFFNSAVGVLQTLVIALGAGLGIWGAINLLEGYGNDNPGAKSQGMKQLMAGGGALIGVPLFFLLKGHIGSSAAALCMMLVMLPFFLLAMYEKNGQPPEKLIRNIVQVCFLRPKQRPYRTNNFYDLLNRQDILDKEVYAIVHKQNPRKKAHTSRAKADRRGDCKSKASG